MAARKIPSDITFDDAEDEVLFTRAALKADPDARALVAHTKGWMALVQAARARDLAAREAVADSDAERIIANARLDWHCTSFGDELWLASGKDATSSRWKTFFNLPVSRFIKQRLSEQASKVRGWLGSKDAVLKKHKAALDEWSAAAEAAVKKTLGIALVRGEATVAREQMAEDLTRERDGVFEALSAVARAKGLPRDWPRQFFRTQSRSGSSAAADDTGSAAGTEDPATVADASTTDAPRPPA